MIHAFFSALGLRLTAGLGAVLAFGLWLLVVTRRARSTGRTEALWRMEDADHEAAADIRAGVRDGLPDRVHKFDDAGWRD